MGIIPDLAGNFGRQLREAQTMGPPLGELANGGDAQASHLLAEALSMFHGLAHTRGGATVLFNLGQLPIMQRSYAVVAFCRPAWPLQGQARGTKATCVA
jgi:hypothetical protein